MAKPHQQSFLCWGQGLFLGAVLLCLDISAPMCFLLSRSGAGASPCPPLLECLPPLTTGVAEPC